MSKKKSCAGKTANGACPTKPELYQRIKAKIKAKFGEDYPSAYASSALVKEYKEKGGGYKK
jgi:hypothetical protein